jgi:hypothetical protein
LGTGNSFTGNGTFTSNQGLFWLQADGSNFQRRTSGGAWVNVGGGTTLAINTNYTLLVEINLTTGLMDISLNGVLLDDGVGVTNAAIDPTGFRVYSVSGSDVEIDNIVLTAVPEPASAALVFGGLGSMFWMIRRRRLVA